jgi:prepilin-type N-terminal cleavage/methylation domain-containing protein/prepilin-type processing-associated H-X9-DG protein
MRRYNRRKYGDSSSNNREIPMNSNARRGFTLVELLVVIAIIGILVGLLLPAVQAARESGRRMQCQNHLKQLGLAMLSHTQANGYLPSGGWGWNWTGDPDRGFGRNQPAGWNYSLLPYIEQENVYLLGSDGQPDVITDQQRNGALQRDQIPIPVFVCPSRRANKLYPRPRNMAYNNGRNVNLAGAIDYAANAGDTYPLWQGGPGTIAAATNGSFNYGATQTNTGISYARSQIKVAHIRDGASNTYMLGEKSLMPNDYTNGMNSADDFGMYEGCAHDTYRWCPPDQQYVPAQDRVGVNYYSAFGGPHAGGCIFVFCDGSVRVISYSIDRVTHSRLANRADGQAISGAF